LSLDRPSGHLPDTLDSLVQQAGGVLVSPAPGEIVQRRGHSVAVNYGSAAGELAACVSAVGLADCSELTKLVLEGRSEQLGRLVSGVAGADVAPGGARFAGGIWWCAESSERVIVLCEPSRGDRLYDQLHARAARRATVSLEDRSADWAALAVVGRFTRPLLSELGVYGESGDPRLVPPLTEHSVTGADLLWLLESDHKAIALMPEPSAASVWHTIERAGRRFGICAVGQEAVARYALIHQARPLL
jgi:glycine cleavage system aminomethyltransferase T